jgi:hypothetical protein
MDLSPTHVDGVMVIVIMKGESYPCEGSPLVGLTPSAIALLMIYNNLSIISPL